MRRKWIRTVSSMIVALAVIVSVSAWSGSGPQKQAAAFAYAAEGRHPDAANVVSTQRGTEYASYLLNGLESGANYSGDTLFYPADRSIEAEGYEYVGGDPEGTGHWMSTGIGDGGGFIRWSVDVPETGLYNISFLYMTLEGSRFAPERELRVDGVLPFDEAYRAKFPRAYYDEGIVRYDQIGDQIRGTVTERREWRWTSFTHPEGYFTRPYSVLLAKGERTISLHDVREPMALAGLRLQAPVSMPAYRVWQDSLRAEVGDASPGGTTIVVEAEDHWSRSNPYIRPNWNRDPLVTPNGVDHVRFNAFGGERWSLGGQDVVYRFEAPKDGWYAITFRMQQSSLNRNSYRKIKIDGDVPFVELEQYPFPFNREWVNHTLAAPDGEEFLFYFDSGVHEISMETLAGPNRPTVDAVRSVVDRLGELRREIQKIVSSTKDASGQLVADTQRDWDLHLYIPDIRERFESLASELQEQLDYQSSLNGGMRNSEIGVLSRAVVEVRQYGEQLEYVPQQLNEMGELLTSLASITQTLTEQPLELDKLYVRDPVQEPPRGTAAAWEKAGSTIRQFFGSFTTNRNQIAGGYPDEGTSRITVSMARGREWAEVLSRMAEEEFTPATGISIDINLLPLHSEHMILLAYTAGKAPDVAMGVSPSIPVEFAIRNSIADLSQFPDFNDIRDRFHGGMLVPYSYEGNYYALPETQDFLMTYYRNDVLEELGLEPPETWEDVYRMLPVLRSSGMDFYFPPGPQSYTFFLYQHGGDFFRDGGAETAIDTAEALAAFEQWTGMYTFHAVQLQADFYQRFRTGEMPVGIAGYDMFVKLMAAAPELYGKWSMNVIPGTERADGSVDHTSGGVIGNTQAVMIMETARDKKAAWEFVKWWTSAETQRRYGEEIEALLGAGSRWNSANIEAFTASDWSADEARVIEEATGWVREQPVVLGSYYVTRQLLNAWNRTVLDDAKKPVRIILEDAVDEINKELSRKRKEFGLE